MSDQGLSTAEKRQTAMQERIDGVEELVNRQRHLIGRLESIKNRVSPAPSPLQPGKPETTARPSGYLNQLDGAMVAFSENNDYLEALINELEDVF